MCMKLRPACLHSYSHKHGVMCVFSHFFLQQENKKTCTSCVSHFHLPPMFCLVSVSFYGNSEWTVYLASMRTLRSKVVHYFDLQ